MTVQELTRANELSDALIAKLERIKALWAEIPTVDDLRETAKEAATLEACLSEARDVSCAENFLRVDDLRDLGKEAATFAASLTEARDIFSGEDFPSADDVDDLGKKLDGLVGSLNEIIEKQAEVAE